MFSATRDAANKSSGDKCLCPTYVGHLYCMEAYMLNGHFYFIKDEFYDNLEGCNLMTNKNYESPTEGGRPCHYCLKHKDYYWMVPVSSRIDKFRSIYNNKISKKGYCDTIRFGYINGQERAFLIQNCFPVTEKYVKEEYKINKNTVPVTISDDLSKELNGLIRKVIRMYEKGIIIPLTDLNKIISYLQNDK